MERWNLLIFSLVFCGLWILPSKSSSSSGSGSLLNLDGFEFIGHSSDDPNCWAAGGDYVFPLPNQLFNSWDVPTIIPFNSTSGPCVVTYFCGGVSSWSKNLPTNLICVVDCDPKVPSSMLALDCKKEEQNEWPEQVQIIGVNLETNEILLVFEPPETSENTFAAYLSCPYLFPDRENSFENSSVGVVLNYMTEYACPPSAVNRINWFQLHISFVVFIGFLFIVLMVRRENRRFEQGFWTMFKGIWFKVKKVETLSVQEVSLLLPQQYSEEDQLEEITSRLHSLLHFRSVCYYTKTGFLLMLGLFFTFETPWYHYENYCVVPWVNGHSFLQCIYIFILSAACHLIPVPTRHTSNFLLVIFFRFWEISRLGFTIGTPTVPYFNCTLYRTWGLGPFLTFLCFYITLSFFNVMTEAVMFEIVRECTQVKVDIKRKSILRAITHWLPPWGFMGFHRIYLGKPFTGALYPVTGGFCFFGWLIDGFLLRRYVNEANRFDIVRVNLPPKYLEPGLKDLKIARLLCIFGGVFGLHRCYLGGSRTMIGGMLQAIIGTVAWESVLILWTHAILPTEYSYAFLPEIRPNHATLTAYVLPPFFFIFAVVVRDYFALKSDLEIKNKYRKQLEATENKKEFLKNIGKSQAEWIINDSELQVGVCIGSGGSAAVFRGKWSNLDVAIKRLHISSNEEEQSVIKEAELHSKLVHDNVLRLYGVCTTPLSFVMEFMSNGSLMQFLNKTDDQLEEGRGGEKLLTKRLALNLSLDIACGLAYLHSKNILHRDLKSLNILISGTYQAKVADFGEARKRASTMTFQVGTVRWASPEQLSTNHYTEKADVWSFGVILFEIYMRLAKGVYVVPYDNCDYDFHVIKRLERREFLISRDDPSSSLDLPSEIRELMLNIFDSPEPARPSFNEIITSLRSTGGMLI